MLPSSVLCQVSLFAASAALAWVDVSETRLTQFALGLIQPAPIRFAGDAIVRHTHTGSFIGGAQLFLDGLDGCQQTHLVTAVPREGLQKKRNISLVGGGQCQHPLFGDYFRSQHAGKGERQLVRRLEQLGYQVTAPLAAS
jgi:hypothetical protein